MKLHSAITLGVIFVAAALLVSSTASATQADDTTIEILGQTAGPAPFISQLALLASQTSVLKNIQFTITPKEGSVTRPLSGTYSRAYLTERGYLNPDTGEIFLPVWGLYSDFTNTVTLTYSFSDGSSKQEGTTIATAAFDDPCGYKTPTILQAKTENNSLSYDYLVLKGACSLYSPAIIDTDGALRWVGTTGLESYNLAFVGNSIYIGDGSLLYRNDLDGTVSFLGDYSDVGVTEFHHNVDRGKVGLIFEADTSAYFESVIMEIDYDGKLLKTWNMADIIAAAMIAGGDDPGQFVYHSPDDWFHSNAVTYNRADDSLIISSREDFLICLDYTSGSIKWILGDPEKQWYQFPSLRQYALTLAPGSLPPIGQHAVSITHDQNVLVFDNGTASLFFADLPGATRTYASPRKYQIDVSNMVATEVWNYPMDESVFSPFCGSVYEDLPLNYLVDYAFVSTPPDQTRYARVLGLDATGEKVFYYQYPSIGCNAVFNAAPLHLENTVFPAIGPQSLNLSTRGLVGPNDDALIAGFIVTGTDPKTVVLRALGPSLSKAGLAGTLADPVLTLYDSAGAVIASNDNWETGVNVDLIRADGLAPSDPAEAALRATLQPGAYTAVVTGKDATPGIGLVETYDLSPLATSRLANLSTRGLVRTGDEVLIGGFIVGEVESETMLIRAIGPSLASSEISDPLGDPILTVYDSNGVVIGSNDNWQDDSTAPQIMQNGLAPTDDAESATILRLPAGAYTAIVSGASGDTGIGLAEFFDLETPAD